MKSKLGALIAAVVAMAMSNVAMAQGPAKSVPMNGDGHPDFTGVWITRGLTTTERGKPGPLVVSDEDAAVVAKGLYDFLRSKEMEADIDPDALAANVAGLFKVAGEWRTSQVTLPEDGKLPFTDEARARLEAAGAAGRTESADGPEQRPSFERCMRGTGTTPLYLVPANNARQFILTRDHFLMYAEEGGDLRHVRIGGAPLPPEVVSRFGDSIGHWDGNELVIETTGVEAYASRFPWGTIVIDESSKVIERLRMVSEDELLYRFTVEDPDLYSRPWSAEFPLFRAGERIYEYGCHEGNHSLPNILRAARVLESGQ